MSDQSEAPITGGDFTPEQLQTMAGWMVEDGRLTREQADAMLRGEDPAKPNAAANGEAPTITTGELTEAQLRALLDADVAEGKLTREQADAMLADQGLSTPPVDKRTDLEKQYDADFPPAKPHEFTLPSDGTVNADAPFDREQWNHEQHVRGWLADGRFTRESGNFIAAEVGRVAQHTEKMSEGEFALYARSERAKLERMYGADFDRKIDLVRQLVAEVEKKRPGVSKFLEVTGAGASATVVAQLVNQAEMLLSRAGG